MRVRAWLLAASVSGCARHQASAPTVVVPPRGSESTGELSRGGTERGDVELGLGVVTGVVAGVLVGVGSYEAWRGVQVKRYCERPSAHDDPNFEAFCTTPLGGDPFVSAIVSSSLSFAFSLPIAVASGYLLRRGVLTRRAWRAANKVSARAWPMSQRGIGLSLSLAF